MRNSKEIAHTLKTVISIYKKTMFVNNMFFSEEMEELPFLAFGILTFSFKKTFILENKGMDDQHIWHMHDVKIEIWLTDYSIENC